VGAEIFLSYSRADRPIAEALVTTAAARGVDVWFDGKIQGGQDWREDIVDKLSKARALVILFSEHSNASKQLIKELAVADSLRKLVVPVLITDCEPQGAYLYELASRNWINIHPNPQTRLAALIDQLATELELSGIPHPPRPAVRASEPVVAAPAAAARVTAAPARAAPATTAPVVSPAPGAATRPLATVVSADPAVERWFPLGRYDLYILVPVMVIAFAIGLLNEAPDAKVGGLGLGVLAAAVYVVIISVRNARLNRSVLSGASFASYFAVLAIAFSPILVSGVADNVASFFGLIILALLLGVAANLLQVVLRKTFMRNVFRSQIGRSLEA
jgi:hypothetical protein